MFENIDKAIEKLGEKLGDKIAKATVEGIEAGAKILAVAIAAKMDELHERDRDRED